MDSHFADALLSKLISTTREAAIEGISMQMIVAGSVEISLDSTKAYVCVGSILL